MMPLFESMPERDQRHCLDVYETLRASGCDDREVLAAALIHDAGKGSLTGARVRLWHRVAYVLLENAPPPLMRAAAGQNRGIDVLQKHGDKGVELAQEFGASPEIVWLLAEMESEGALDERVAMLKAADEKA